jgi:5'(3')-deoxyribonucleotidase
MGEGTTRRLFVDMDGVLARFTPVDEIERLYEKGYFRSLEPQLNVIGAVRDIAAAGGTEVYILSGVLRDSDYAWDEKIDWLKEYLPELQDGKTIFTPCGIPKTDQSQWFLARGGIADTARFPITEKDILLDDYTANLTDWEAAGGTGIKLVNDINHKKGIWKGFAINYMSPPAALTEYIRASLAIDGSTKNMASSQEENLLEEEDFEEFEETDEFEMDM